MDDPVLVGGASDKAGINPMVCTTQANIPAGSIVFVTGAFDSTSTNTPEVSSISDGGAGLSWTSYWSNSSSSSNLGGVITCISFAYTANQINSGTSIGYNTSASITAHTVHVGYIGNANGVTEQWHGQGVSTSGGPTTTVNTTIPAGSIGIGCAGIEANSTSTSSYSGFSTTFTSYGSQVTSGGGSASNIGSVMRWQKFTVGEDANAVSPIVNFTTSSDSSIEGIVFKPPSGSNFTATPTDNMGLTDASINVYTPALGKTDSMGMTDSLIIQPLKQELTDNLGLTDTRAFDFTVTLADNMGLTDTRGIGIGLVRTDAEDLTDIRAFSPGLGILEALGLTDTRAFDATTTLADTMGLTDQQATDITTALPDTLGLTDVAGVDLGLVITDDLGLTDSVDPQLSAGAQNYTATPADDLGLTDSLLLEEANAIVQTDDLGMTDTQELVATYDHAYSHDLDLTDSLLVEKSLTVLITDDLGMSDTVLTEEANDLTLAEDLGLTDSLLVEPVYNYAVTLSDDLGATDATAVGISLSLTDAQDLTDSVATEAVRTVTLTDTADLSDSLTFEAALARDLTDAADLTDSVAFTATYDHAYTDTMGLTDSVTAQGTPPVDGMQMGYEIIISPEYGSNYNFTETPVDSMGLTDSLITAAGADLPARVGTQNTQVEEESHGYCPVFKDTNGNLYTITESLLADNNQPRAMKSTNGGETWTEMDAANRPGTDTGGIGDLESGWITQESGFLTFTWQRSYVVWVRFRTSDHPTNPDTWMQNTRNNVAAVTGSPQYASHTAPADQNYHYVFASNGTGSIYVPVTASTGNEGTQNTLDSGGISPAAALGPSNVSYVIYKSGSTLQFRTLSSIGSLSGATRVDTNGTHSEPIPHAKPIIYTNGGDTIVTCLFLNASAHLKAVDIVNGTPGAEQTITTTAVMANPDSTANQSAVITGDVDGTTVHAFWSDSATGDLMHSSRAHGGSWSTPAGVSAVNALLTTGVYWVYAKTLSGVIGLRYSDGFDVTNELNDIWYAEWVL